MIQSRTMSLGVVNHLRKEFIENGICAVRGDIRGPILWNHANSRSTVCLDRFRRRNIQLVRWRDVHYRTKAWATLGGSVRPKAFGGSTE